MAAARKAGKAGVPDDRRSGIRKADVTITAQDHTFASNGTARSWDRYDVDGLACWLAKLEGESAVTRLELMRDFTNSEEYRKYQDTLMK